MSNHSTYSARHAQQFLQLKNRAATVKRSRRSRLQFERLEARFCLAAELAVSDPLQAPINWFASYDHVSRQAFSSLDQVDQWLPAGVAGPIAPSTGEWIIQLSDDAADEVQKAADIEALLNRGSSRFDLIAGLGVKGQLLVRGVGSSREAIEAELKDNSNVTRFSLNQMIEGQAVSPNDPEFASGLMNGLAAVNVPSAWDVSRGSANTVIGVVDTGINVTHVDLYLNVWLNQGEIPQTLLGQLTDIDNDGLITFYDLNNATRSTTAPYGLTVNGFATGPNQSLVRDINNNGRIDADDLLKDPNWSDGRDTDLNGFADDFFGVNFRSGSGDLYAANNPVDVLGHGTHVAGTLGAIGSNSTGVVGLNWQTSLMSLRILDEQNRGDTSAAIRAVNYANQMRERYATDSQGRVTTGANIKVLNNSWGQPGGYDPALETAIRENNESGILFVAAAGNGNVLGQGVDNDRTPFFPASYDSPNVIAVAALDDTGRPAQFSNFGSKTVDIFAPGVGIRSTLKGNAYGAASGTSMATPHVAGAAALVWSAYPEASVSEVRQAILSTATPSSALSNLVATQGKLNAAAALNADVFSPAAQLIAKQDITVAGGASTEFTIQYYHRSGINVSTIGDDDILITRTWGSSDTLTARLKVGSIVQTPTNLTATYVVDAPGGSWDAFDYGDYVISTVAGTVAANSGDRKTESRPVGAFNVKINEPNILYVQTNSDTVSPGSLRAAIIAANAATPTPQTIILNSGIYNLSIPPEADPTSTFPDPPAASQITPSNYTRNWSGPTTGDLDITGNVTVVGDRYKTTSIQAGGIDRIFKVHPGATLNIKRVALSSGLSPNNQGGGGILSAGVLTVVDSKLERNVAKGGPFNGIGGGAIAAWGGSVSVSGSWFTRNEADFGGGVLFAGNSTGNIDTSTFDRSVGGAIVSRSFNHIEVDRSTFSNNQNGAIVRGFEGPDGAFGARSSISADGQWIAFETEANDLSPLSNSNSRQIFLFNRQTGSPQFIGEGTSPHLSSNGRYVAYVNMNNGVTVFNTLTRNLQSYTPASLGVDFAVNPTISDDGNFVAFSNLQNVYLVNRQTQQVATIALGSTGSSVGQVQVSSDSQFVIFSSDSNNLSIGDNNQKQDVFLYERATGALKLISHNASNTPGNDFSGLSTSSQSITIDNRYIVFNSIATNLDGVDPNDAVTDVYIYDRSTDLASRLSLPGLGDYLNDYSFKPTISPNGRYISFASYATNTGIPGTDTRQLRIYLFDRQSQTLKVIQPDNQPTTFSNFTDYPVVADTGATAFLTDLRFSSRDRDSFTDLYYFDPVDNSIKFIDTPYTDIDVTSATFALNSAASAVLTRGVNASSSLFAQNSVTNDVVPDGAYNYRLPDSSGNLLSKYYFEDDKPPVHQLYAGNPAINAGDPSLAGQFDQLGHPRDVPDVGAVEAVSANIGGSVYLDRNRNGIFDPGEVPLPFFDIQLSSTPGLNSALNLQTQSKTDDSLTNLNEAGQYELPRVTPGTSFIGISGKENWMPVRAPIAQVRSTAAAPNGISSNPSLSEDGVWLAFDSEAKNLVSGDTNNVSDVFLYNTRLKTIKRISVPAAGGQANNGSFKPIITADGRYIIFQSGASNLDPADTDFQSDIYLFDQLSDQLRYLPIPNIGPRLIGIDSVTISGDGSTLAFTTRATVLSNSSIEITSLYFMDVETGNVTALPAVPAWQAGSYFDISLSHDGRYVVFQSADNNLVASDQDSQEDIYLYGRLNETMTRVSTPMGSGPNYNLYPSISASGRLITFTSLTSSLVSGDNNHSYDVFLYDVSTGVTKLVSKTAAGTQGNGDSVRSNISTDEHYILFSSASTNFDPRVVSNFQQVYVKDLRTDELALLSLSAAGVPGIGSARDLTMSADGSVIAFSSAATNLAVPDANGADDIFVSPNRLLPVTTRLDLLPGDLRTDIHLGVVPLPGTISGRVFVDTVPNGVFDTGEAAVVGAIVYLDTNQNGVLDTSEARRSVTAAGTYTFANLDSFMEYQVRVQLPANFEQRNPSAADGFAWKVFLDAGGLISDRNFAAGAVSSTGQASDSSVSGRLYDDRNGNGVFDMNIDSPLANTEVFLDSHNLGVRDFDEPRVVTNSDGIYSIAGLGTQNVAVATTLDANMTQTTPLGSSFDIKKIPVFNTTKPFADAQAIAKGDFNRDGFEDVAVVFGAGNLLSIRLNDKVGGFLAQTIDIDLGAKGVGPTSLVVGQFDNDARLDIAITASYSKNVVILRNFDSTTNQFVSRADVAVGVFPIDIAIGQFGGDSKPDLVVLNQLNAVSPGNSTVQVLINNGSGVFQVGAAVLTGGKNATSIVAGDFIGDANTDIAVVNRDPMTAGTPNGGVSLLRGNGIDSLLATTNYYELGASPIDAVTGDFNGDGRTDIAVTNFKSSSISILKGQTTGGLAVQSAVLGTASGAYDITAGDIDNDDDIDIIASNLKDSNLAIFRNVGVVSGDAVFEPLENVGLALFGSVQRMPLLVSNFNQDTSGPNGTGTLDIVTIPQSTSIPTLQVLNNTLINGARRVALTGLNQVTGLDFIVKPKILPPSFNDIASPLPILEDAAQQSVSISGIKKGRSTSPSLRFSVTSSNTALISNASVVYNANAASATLVYKPNANANGVAVLTVRATETGLDGVFETADDAIFERSVTVTVLSVNDAPKFSVPLQTTVTQKQGAVTIPAFATNLSRGGGADEAAQVLSAFVVSNNATYFAVAPKISATGALTFTPKTTNSGLVPITIRLSDNGGVANGGSNSTTQTVFINIQPVNDRPSINLLGNQTVVAGSAAQTVTGFASGFLPGGGVDEQSQTIAGFVISTDRPDLFRSLPAIDNSGVLRYQSVADTSGIATVSVQVRDNGGTANGGLDLSLVKTFRITVQPNPDKTAPAPVLTISSSIPTTQLNFTVTVTFGEPISGLSLASFTVTGGTASQFRTVDAAIGRYSILVTRPTTGRVTVQMLAGVARDLAGNSSLQSNVLTVL